MDSSSYRQKLEALLGEANTYLQKEAGFCTKQSTQFNKDARKLLKKSEEGKKLIHLLEEAPKSP